MQIEHDYVARPDNRLGKEGGRALVGKDEPALGGDEFTRGVAHRGVILNDMDSNRHPPS
jgi:hypothetical protein